MRVTLMHDVCIKSIYLLLAAIINPNDENMIFLNGLNIE